MKTLWGKVVSIKAQKTAIVEREHFWVHPLYEKRVRRTKRYAIHLPQASVGQGDLVEFVQSRPISKTKKWVLARVIKSAKPPAAPLAVAEKSARRRKKK